MCLIVFALDPNPRYRLVVAANRDEFYGRPTAPADFWDDEPYLLAGRDLRRGGTWMGVTQHGRFSAITNYRDPEDRGRRERSRGFLVSDFLKSAVSPSAYLDSIRPHADEYDGFNLLVGDVGELLWYSNRGDGPRKLSHGLYGLSNDLLDTPWPKVERSKASLRELLDSDGELSPERVFPVLADDVPASDGDLPDTGVGIELERALSPPFIRTKEYGTRSSTVLTIESSGRVTFAERRFVPGDGDVRPEPEESVYEFGITV